MRAGAVLLMASSICLAFVGVFTVENILLHGIAAFGFFMLTPLAFLLISFGTRDRRIRRLSLTCGISALLAILVLPFAILALPFKLGFAAPELIEALAISAWTIYMATRLYRNR